MRKLAVAVSGEKVCNHIDKCKGLMIYDIDGKNIVKSYFSDVDEGKDNSFLQLLEKIGVQTLITNGISDQELLKFKENNIDVISGTFGKADEIVEKLLK